MKTNVEVLNQQRIKLKEFQFVDCRSFGFDLGRFSWIVVSISISTIITIIILAITYNYWRALISKSYSVLVAQTEFIWPF